MPEERRPAQARAGRQHAQVVGAVPIDVPGIDDDLPEARPGELDASDAPERVARVGEEHLRRPAVEGVAPVDARRITRDAVRPGDAHHQLQRGAAWNGEPEMNASEVPNSSPAAVPCRSYMNEPATSYTRTIPELVPRPVRTSGRSPPGRGCRSPPPPPLSRIAPPAAPLQRAQAPRTPASRKSAPRRRPHWPRGRRRKGPRRCRGPGPGHPRSRRRTDRTGSLPFVCGQHAPVRAPSTATRAPSDRRPSSRSHRSSATRRRNPRSRRRSNLPSAPGRCRSPRTRHPACREHPPSAPERTNTAPGAGFTGAAKPGAANCVISVPVMIHVPQPDRALPIARVHHAGGRERRAVLRDHRRRPEAPPVHPGKRTPTSTIGSRCCSNPAAAGWPGSPSRVLFFICGPYLSRRRFESVQSR